MRPWAFMVIAVVLADAAALAQEPEKAPSTTPPAGVPSPEQIAPPDQPAPDQAKEPDEKAWSFSAVAYTYIVPHDRDYVQPTFTADRDWLHLEARYNYEALDTASAWVGYNFSGGEALTWEVTPMLGGVFGDELGIAPGYKGSLGWGKIELYSEGEYVFDTGDSSNSFFYNWSELTVAPVDWLRFGVVAQRTRAYEAERDIQRGLLVGVSWRDFDFTCTVLNPDDDSPTVILGVAVSF